MEVGHIVPINYLSFVRGRKFHLVLAHMIQQNEKYRNFYKEEAKNGTTIILDNSSYELGDSWISPEGLIDIYNSLKSENVYLMCPEVAFDSKATIKAVKTFKKILNKKGLFPKTFGTIHGKSISDIVECYKKVSEVTDYIGFSYRIWCEDIKTMYPVPVIERGLMRINVIRKLFEKNVINILKPHHLLGISDPCELYEQSRYPWIRSADSSTCYVHARNNIWFDPSSGLRSRKRVTEKINFNDEHYVFVEEGFKRNMKILDDFGRDGD